MYFTVALLNDSSVCLHISAYEHESLVCIDGMYASFALFYAVVTVFYFVVQFMRARLAKAMKPTPPYVPPPTTDVAFVVRVLMQNGKWGIAMQRHKYYYRLPMLIRHAQNAGLGGTPSLVSTFVDHQNQHTTVAVFTAVDEFSLPHMMPKTDMIVLDAEFVIGMIQHLNGELSITTIDIMRHIQEKIFIMTAKGQYGWFLGK